MIVCIWTLGRSGASSVTGMFFSATRKHPQKVFFRTPVKGRLKMTKIRITLQLLVAIFSKWEW